MEEAPPPLPWTSWSIATAVSAKQRIFTFVLLQPSTVDSVYQKHVFGTPATLLPCYPAPATANLSPVTANLSCPQSRRTCPLVGMGELMLRKC